MEQKEPTQLALQLPLPERNPRKPRQQSPIGIWWVMGQDDSCDIASPRVEPNSSVVVELDID